MKHIIRKMTALFLAAVLVLMLSACRTRKVIVVSSEVHRPTTPTASSTSSEKSSVAPEKNPTPIVSRPTASVHTAKPSSTESATVNPLRKSWSSLSASDKKTLESCGLKEEDLVVDKKALTYDAEKSKTVLGVKYDCYTHGEMYYYFNDPKEKLTGIDYEGRYTPSSENVISETEAKRIAAVIADLFIDVAAYTFRDYAYAEGSNTHTVVYRRQVGKYTTLEGLIISLYSDGKLSGIYIAKLGLFDGVTAPTVDEKQLDTECGKILKERHDNYQSHTMGPLKLDIRDGQFLAYYREQPEIPYGQMVMICECYPTFTNGIKGRGEFVLVPLT